MGCSRMSKSEALEQGFCEKACGLYCHRSQKPNCDMFQGDPPVTVKSRFCRLSPEDIEIMKAEHNYNPKTRKLGNYGPKQAKGEGE